MSHVVAVGSDPVNLLAGFDATAAGVAGTPVTIITNPPGLSFTVGAGVQPPTYTSYQARIASGSLITVGIATSQLSQSLAGNQFTFQSWSDGLAAPSHPPVTVGDSAMELVANFVAPTTPSEQTLTLLPPVTYSQVHALDYFNISTGVIRSSLRNPSFSRSEISPAIPCPTGVSGCTAVPEMYKTVETPGSPAIDPALFFTVYAFGPFDAERKWRWSDLKPEPSIGLSLSSPATDFFFGASSEFPLLRGIQIVGGCHYGKINTLAPTLVNDPTSSAAPATIAKFHPGYYFGVTFNINFIQSLFGAVKGGG
jgi:hypothetical protein